MFLLCWFALALIYGIVIVIRKDSDVSQFEIILLTVLLAPMLVLLLVLHVIRDGVVSVGQRFRKA